MSYFDSFLLFVLFLLAKESFSCFQTEFLTSEDKRSISPIQSGWFIRTSLLFVLIYTITWNAVPISNHVLLLVQKMKTLIMPFIWKTQSVNCRHDIGYFFFLLQPKTDNILTRYVASEPGQKQWSEILIISKNSSTDLYFSQTSNMRDLKKEKNSYEIVILVRGKGTGFLLLVRRK